MLKLAPVLGENSYSTILRSGERVHVLEHIDEAWRRKPLEYYAMKYASDFVQRGLCGWRRKESSTMRLLNLDKERGGDSEK
jgi:hypothetical protein